MSGAHNALHTLTDPTAKGDQGLLQLHKVYALASSHSSTPILTRVILDA